MQIQKCSTYNFKWLAVTELSEKKSDEKIDEEKSTSRCVYGTRYWGAATRAKQL